MIPGVIEVKDPKEELAKAGVRVGRDEAGVLCLIVPDFVVSACDNQVVICITGRAN